MSGEPLAFVDTNILVRAVVLDDAKQGKAAAKLLTDASLVAIALPCLCELVWVLEDVYHYGKTQIAGTLEHLLRSRELRVQNSERAWAAWRAAGGAGTLPRRSPAAASLTACARTAGRMVANPTV